jgi:ribosomal silencing factor RsfS
MPGNREAEWNIIDQSGRIVMQGISTEERQRINLEKLPAGLYFLRTEIEGEASSKRFVKL